MQRNKYGLTALHLACETGRDEVIPLLSENKKVDFNMVQFQFILWDLFQNERNLQNQEKKKKETSISDTNTLESDTQTTKSNLFIRQLPMEKLRCI